MNRTFRFADYRWKFTFGLNPEKKFGSASIWVIGIFLHGSSICLIINTLTKKCSRTIFSEPLAMTLPYGRNTHEVEKRIRHEALNQTARKACQTLAMQHIHVSQSSLIRALRLMGSVNPEVRTSGYVGIDDFA